MQPSQATSPLALGKPGPLNGPRQPKLTPAWAMLVLALTALWAPVSETQPVNLVPDPSFEEGTEGWSEAAHPSAPGTSLRRGTSGASEPHSGSYGYALSNQASGYLESAPLEVRPGDEYELSAWA